MQRYMNRIMHLYSTLMRENHNYPEVYRVTPITHSAYMTSGIEPGLHWWLGNLHDCMVFKGVVRLNLSRNKNTKVFL